MSRYRVCVYAITKNEEKFVRRWMQSMGEADHIVVTDTGSTDNTVALLRELGAEVYEEVVEPWRFDVARNLSLSHVPDDMDILVCTDLDEVLRPGWRENLERAWEPGATMGNYLYNWSLLPDGTPHTQFVYFKVHTKRDYTWVCPVHEYLKYTGAAQPQNVFIEGMVLDHYPDPAKSRGSYLPLLEMAVREEPLSDRMTYYLGREYLFMGRWGQCIATLERYLALPGANWPEERCAAMRWIAKSHAQLDGRDEAYRWYLRAIAEAPQMRDAYVEFATLAYRYGDWPTVFYATERALRITERSDCFINAGHAWDHTPDDLAAIACYSLGLYDRSLEHAQNALALAPGDERLQNNTALIYRACSGSADRPPSG